DHPPILHRTHNMIEQHRNIVTFVEILAFCHSPPLPKKPERSKLRSIRPVASQNTSDCEGRFALEDWRMGFLLRAPMLANITPRVLSGSHERLAPCTEIAVGTRYSSSTVVKIWYLSGRRCQMISGRFNRKPYGTVILSAAKDLSGKEILRSTASE